MNSLVELQAIKEKNKDTVIPAKDSGKIRVVVGMATCGIAAGARPVLDTFVEEIKNSGLSDKVTVLQTGCIGICQFEPVVEIYEAGKEKVTYVKMTAEKAKEVIEGHLKGGQVVEQYVYSAVATGKGEHAADV
ncbi:MAG: (2Fe-2S) ferredoxin domain-containing protein, partial [Clostridia bacterium]|nr:(2Fe-2S) ferredoxin domain-containing protein [Clostridia bacterium]